MIHLGTPDDLKAPTLKRYCCIVAYVYDSYDDVAFAHCFCMAVDTDAAYCSSEMYALEDNLRAKGNILKNNYVVEVGI